MAFGISAKHNEDLPLDNLSQQQFLVLAIEAAKKLGWSLGQISETEFLAYTKFSMSSWSEEVRVTINDTTANLVSRCTGSQLMDWGKNKTNIENFISTFNELKNTYSEEQLAQKFEELKPTLLSKEQVTQMAPASTEQVTSFLSIFKPTEGYFITPILININIAVFILMTISGVNFFLPDNESLII